MTDAVQDSIHWPDTLSTDTFLAQYWQQRPLLIPQALPEFINPLPADELAGLALEEDTTPRLVIRDADDHYRLEAGPFEAARFAELGDTDWSLLVTDTDKHLPELAEWLKPFQFIPGWRFDDLMISYAPDKASVGAHIDEYDVFLLQVSGQRRWSIDSRPDCDRQLRSGGDLRLLAHFDPNESWVLAPGDMLYLPPGVPHHGIAVGDDCMTWSIGFRAPSAADVLSTFAERLADELDTLRYRDPQRSAAVAGSRGEIDAASLAAVTQLWESATTVTPERLNTLTGVLLTSGSTQHLHSSDTTSLRAGDSCSWRLHPFSQAAYLQDTTLVTEAASELVDQATPQAALFVDGQLYLCSLELARHVSEPGSRWLAERFHTSLDERVLQQLIARGSIVPD